MSPGTGTRGEQKKRRKIRRVRLSHRSISRAIDLSCRACGAGAGCWAWIPGRGNLRFYTPNLRFRDAIQKVFQEAFRKIGRLKKTLAKVVDFEPLGPLSGPGAPDSDLGRFQSEVER